MADGFLEILGPEWGGRWAPRWRISFEDIDALLRHLRPLFSPHTPLLSPSVDSKDLLKEEREEKEEEEEKRSEGSNTIYNVTPCGAPRHMRESRTEDICEILAELNRLSGFAYRRGRVLSGLLGSLLAEYSKEEVLSVVRFKCSQWGKDPKMRTYLRPSTLFRKSKFADYLGQANQAKVVEQHPLMEGDRWLGMLNLAHVEKTMRERGEMIPWLTHPLRKAMSEDRLGTPLEPIGPHITKHEYLSGEIKLS